MGGDWSPVRAGAGKGAAITEGPGPTRIATTKCKGIEKNRPPALSSYWCLLGEVRQLGSQVMKCRGASSQGTEKGRGYTGVLVVVQSLSHVRLYDQGLQYTRLPCPSLSPGACSNSCLLSQ